MATGVKRELTVFQTERLPTPSAHPLLSQDDDVAQGWREPEPRVE